MKFLKAARAAMFLALVTLMPGVLSAQSMKCLVGHLQGSYAVAASGSASSIGQITLIGVETFDGAGNTTVTETASFNGFIVQTSISGTYTVNQDCTGSIVGKFPDGSIGHLSFVIADNAKTIYFMEADNVVNLSGVMTKL